MRFSLDPGVLAILAIAGALYHRAVTKLRRRGRRISRFQQLAWYSGLALLAIALMGPASGYVDRLMVAHMAEHLLIADLAAPLLLTGIRTPVLQFLLPVDVLRPLSRSRALKRVGRLLVNPPVALAVYLVVLYTWHLGFAFEGALRNEWLHAFQHQSFVAISLLVWWSALEPQRRHMPGHLWKIGHISAVRLVSIFLGMGLIFSRSPWYPGFYGDRAREFGLTPLADQQLAGGMMMTLDIIIITFALTLFFWRAAADYDRFGDTGADAEDVAEAPTSERKPGHRPGAVPSNDAA